jgi:hypothetical protein
MSKEKNNACLWQRFSIASVVKVCGKHQSVSTDGGRTGTYYPQACRFLRLSHLHLHSTFEKKLRRKDYTTIHRGKNKRMF